MNLGCANCHGPLTGGAPVPVRQAAPLERVAGAGERGCLAAPSDQPGTAPRFALSAVERADIIAFLESLDDRRCDRVPADDLAVALERLSCTSCHAFHADRGPGAALSPWFASHEEADLGDEGRVPPDLSDVGGRLQTSWMHRVLSGPDRARPWMLTRMPQFHDALIPSLPGLFAQSAGATTLLDESPPFDVAKAEQGRQLVGSKGLNCIECHAISGHDATGTPGPDLALIPGRFRYEAYRRWLRNPSNIRPGTRMPSFFQFGRSGVTSVLSGDADAQIAAIWSYLEQGELGALPEGLSIKEDLLLRVVDEPLVFRSFMLGAGVRAIAFGFPEQVHGAFDATRCWTVLAWRGAFLDASGAWANRGGTETNPADIIWQAPTGPFVELVGEEATMLTFRGYVLDDARAPTFLYDVASGGRIVRAEQAPRATRTESGLPALRIRTVFTGSPGTVIRIRDDANGAMSEMALDREGRLEIVREIGR